MSGRPEIVVLARGWIGTPYRHQASVPGAGADCLGLVRGLWRALYGGEPEAPPPYSRDWSEASGEEVLWQGAARHLVAKPVEPLEAGDVILFRMRDGLIAKHLGIVAETGAKPSFVHAYARHGVVESSLSLPWRRRIVAAFQFPGGSD